MFISHVSPAWLARQRKQDSPAARFCFFHGFLSALKALWSFVPWPESTERLALSSSVTPFASCQDKPFLDFGLGSQGAMSLWASHEYLKPHILSYTTEGFCCSSEQWIQTQGLGVGGKIFLAGIRKVVVYKGNDIKGMSIWDCQGGKIPSNLGFQKAKNMTKQTRQYNTNLLQN